jgi:hypothetical protein
MSIALTTPFTVTINGSQVENDTVGACTGMSYDYIGNILTYTFEIGTLMGSPANLNAGPYGLANNQQVVVTVNCLTGAWSDNHGHSGVIPGSILNPIIAQLLANRNTAESFVAASGGLMPGVTTAWTAL